MACNHKFIDDLQLQYVDWSPKTLFIGTFNPEWSECDNNNAQWFYGRIQRNEFWCILPKIFGHPSLLTYNRESWISFCRKNEIAITDILSTIDAEIDNPSHLNAICKFKDDDISNFDVTVNSIPTILDAFPSIKQICITRMSFNEFWEDCFMDTIQYIQTHPERNLKLKYLRSPSRGARRGVTGNFCEFVSNRWIEQGFAINP
jgi:hypothetical protein